MQSRWRSPTNSRFGFLPSFNTETFADNAYRCMYAMCNCAYGYAETVPRFFVQFFLLWVCFTASNEKNTNIASTKGIHDWGSFARLHILHLESIVFVCLCGGNVLVNTEYTSVIQPQQQYSVEAFCFRVLVYRLCIAIAVDGTFYNQLLDIQCFHVCRFIKDNIFLVPSFPLCRSHRALCAWCTCCCLTLCVIMFVRFCGYYAWDRYAMLFWMWNRSEK